MKIKSAIDNAISVAAFSLSSEWSLFTYCLTKEEEKEELKKVEKAWETLEAYGLSKGCVYKHLEREAKYIVISDADASEFIAIDEKDLPF